MIFNLYKKERRIFLSKIGIFIETHNTFGCGWTKSKCLKLDDHLHIFWQLRLGITMSDGRGYELAGRDIPFIDCLFRQNVGNFGWVFAAQ